MSNYDKVKIVVVGDSGVGKTSAVHLICHNQPLSNPSWTVGCALEVKLHDFKAGTPQQKTYFVDLWDIGGSSSHRNTRGVFYNGVNGIILVHDLTNRKSEANLHKWIMEILSKNNGAKYNEEDEFDPEQFVGGIQIPVFVIGTKMESLEGSRNRRPSGRASSIAEECGAEEMFLNCLDAKSIAPGSTAAVKLSRFFDVVIQRRFYRENASPLFDRKKINPPHQKIFNDEYY